MQPTVQSHFAETLKHLYINPLEKCNLRCKICYTRKTSPILSQAEILTFVKNYQAEQTIDTITFCGGEVFALQYFPELLNALTKQGLFLQVITNGTLDVLEKIQTPNSINLIVSLDGTEELHDANRGDGNYRKSLDFLKHARDLGFNLEIFSIIHRQNLLHIADFEAALTQELGFLPPITYHPRKPPQYLSTHPIANIMGEVKEFDFLTPAEMLRVMKQHKVFPPKDLGCYQIAVASDGKVYGCCEGTMPIGTMQDSPKQLIAALRARVEGWSTTNTLIGCLGCSQPEFMCGIKQYLHQLQAAS